VMDSVGAENVAGTDRKPIEAVMFNWNNGAGSQFNCNPGMPFGRMVYFSNVYPTAQAVWNRLDVHVQAGSAGVADGAVTVSLQTPEGGFHTQTFTGMSTHAVAASAWNYLVFQNYCGNGLGDLDVWIDDLFIQNGSQARVELADAATWAGRTWSEVQPSLRWDIDGGRIDVTLNRGSFAVGRTVYLYVVRADGSVNANGFPLTIAASGGNHAPSAAAQSVQTVVDTPIAITLQATDADGDGLSYAVVSQPMHGAIVLVGNQCTYQPDPGYVGSDVFTFHASDGSAASSPATVSIAVAAAGSGQSSAVVGTGESGGCGAGALSGLLLVGGLLLQLRHRVRMHGDRLT
jgi:hypothetical protein